MVKVANHLAQRLSTPDLLSVLPAEAAILPLLPAITQSLRGVSVLKLPKAA